MHCSRAAFEQGRAGKALAARVFRFFKVAGRFSGIAFRSRVLRATGAVLSRFPGTGFRPGVTQAHSLAPVAARVHLVRPADAESPKPFFLRKTAFPLDIWDDYAFFSSSTRVLSCWAMFARSVTALVDSAMASAVLAAISFISLVPRLICSDAADCSSLAVAMART